MTNLLVYKIRDAGNYSQYHFANEDNQELFFDKRKKVLATNGVTRLHSLNGAGLKKGAEVRFDEDNISGGPWWGRIVEFKKVSLETVEQELREAHVEHESEKKRIEQATEISITEHKRSFRKNIVLNVALVHDVLPDDAKYNFGISYKRSILFPGEDTIQVCRIIEDGTGEIAVYPVGECGSLIKYSKEDKRLVHDPEHKLEWRFPESPRAGIEVGSRVARLSPTRKYVAVPDSEIDAVRYVSNSLFMVYAQQIAVVEDKYYAMKDAILEGEKLAIQTHENRLSLSTVVRKLI